MPGHAWGGSIFRGSVQSGRPSRSFLQALAMAAAASILLAAMIWLARR